MGPRDVTSQCSAYGSTFRSVEGSPPPATEAGGERGKRPPPHYLEIILKEDIAMEYFTAIRRYVFGTLENCCNNNDEGVAGVRFIHFCRGQFCEKYSKMLFGGGAVGSNLNGLQSTVLSKFPIIF